MNLLKTAQVQQKCWGIIACSAVWLIAAAGITPLLTIITFKEIDNKTYCLDFASTPRIDDVRLYSWLLTAFGFLLPLLVVFMCYFGIVKKLSKGPYTTSPSRMRARRSTVLILVGFVVCFLPFHVMRALRIETRKMQDLSCMMKHIVIATYIISRPLAGLNTFFNLALYSLSGDMFRKSFLSTFYWKCWLTTAKSRIQLAVTCLLSSMSDNFPTPERS